MKRKEYTVITFGLEISCRKGESFTYQGRELVGFWWRAESIVFRVRHLIIRCNEVSISGFLWSILAYVGKTMRLKPRCNGYEIRKKDFI